MSLTDRIAALTPEQRALFEKLRERQPAKVRTRQPPPVIRRSGPTGEGDWPLSFDQERLWFMHQLDPGNTAFNIDAVSHFRGRVDYGSVEGCIEEIVRRHGAWRTTFQVVDGQPVQRVVPHRRQALRLIDLSGLPEEVRWEAALEGLFASTRTLFDLERGPLLRTSLFRLAEDDHVFLLTIHHLATDWITFQLFFRELAALYEAARQGRPSPLPEPPVHFSDYAVWQREWLDEEVQSELVEWWRKNLEGFPLVLELPTDRPRPALQRMHGDRVMIDTGRERGERMRAFARQEGVTPFMFFTAVVYALLHRFSGQEKMILGSNSANRNRPEIEPVLGYFLTQLCFPVDLSGAPSFRELLGRVRRSALEAYAHQELPFGKLVEALKPERDTSRPPLVQSLVLVLDGHYNKLEVGGLTFEPISLADANARYDLMFGVYDYLDRGYRGPLEFDADVFDKTTVARLAEMFYRFVDAVIADPLLAISSLPVLSEAGRHQALVEWSDTAGEAAGATVPARFEERAAAAPESTALVVGGAEVSFGALDGRANRLARRLRALGVGPEVRVALLLDRTPDLVAAILGAWKASGACVALDPEQPAARLTALLADAEAAVLVHAGPLPEGLSPAGSRSFDLTAEDAAIDALDGSPLGEAGLERGPRGGDLAYMIYTSGTTGVPKAVMVEHASLASTLEAVQEAFRFGPEDRMPHLARFSFDISLFELFAPLLAGGTCEILGSDEVLEPAALLAAAGRATRLHAVPSLMRRIAGAARERGAEAFPRMRTLFTGGDLVPPDLAADLLEAFPRSEVAVLYGPTEASIVCTAHRVPRGRRPERSLIGRPFRNVRVVVADERGQPAPLGAPGELCIGGPGVARGYFRRDELNAEKFFERDGARFYRTGDRVRHRMDGELEFLGRTDQQVKVRGFRVEPGEVEAALAAHPAVREAAVVALDDRTGEKRLVAYVAVDPETGAAVAARLRADLVERLPAYMVPSAIVPLPELPVTSHGKLDRARLPEPEELAGDEELSDPPRTPTEELVASVFCEILGRPRIGRTASFFGLGGHSLGATQVAMRLSEAARIDLPVRTLFQAPTVAELAAAVEAALAAGEGPSTRSSLPLRPVPRDRDIPLSVAQERLWFIDRLAPGNPVYNMTTALRLSGELDPAALERGFAGVIARHEALRTTFEEREGQPVQVVHPPGGWRLAFEDLSGLGPEEREAEIRQVHSREVSWSFDLVRGPLLRTVLLRCGPAEHVLVLTVHHIVTDAWSMGILAWEAVALTAGEELPPLPVQYADYSVWQREYLDGLEMARQMDYWKEHLGGAPRLELPADHPRPAVPTFRGGSSGFEWPEERTRELEAFARREDSTLFMVLTAVWAAQLVRLTGQEDLVVGSGISNRERPEVEKLIGFFVNVLALRFDASGDPTVRELIARVRRVVLDGFAHRDVSFGRLVQELNPERERGHQSLFQTLFELQNSPRPSLRLGDLQAEGMEVASETAKFDLSWNLEVLHGELLGCLEYSADLFEPATARRLVEQYQRLLEAAVAAPDLRVSDLPLLSAEERRQILVDWNETAAEFPREATLHGLFAEQASLRPEAPALVWDGGEMSYGELGRRSAALARRLAAEGVGPETPVALLAERSPELFVGLLAVLQAGGFYVPLDPAYPPERLRLMLEDSGAAVLLHEPGLPGRLPEELRAGLPRLVSLDAAGPDAVSAEGAPPLPAVGPENLAYLMYTSGSTGTPKGVAVTHRNVARLVHGADYADFGPQHTFLQFAPVSFDASTLEIWGALLHGGRLALHPGRQASLDELAAAIERHRVTTLWLTAGLFHSMVEERAEALRPLRQLLAGGDALSPAHVQKALEALPEVALIDGYGPTEGTTFTCCHRLSSPEEAFTPSGTVSIGRPIANARVYVLDRHFQPVPPGVPGELLAGGEGLARGYFRGPAPTAERFVPDPFAGLRGEPGARLYRTGDLVRRLPDGRIEFLGRNDAQVKIRGFRVELGEVESTLAASPEVAQAAVGVRDDPAGGKELVAWVVARDGAAADLPARLQRFVRERLPEPFVPAAWTVIEALPLTPNGKVDRQALAALEATRAAAAVPRVAPRTPLEERIVAASAEVLGLDAERVGVQDNFFDLGGHSLLGTRLAARLRDRWGIELPLQDLFDASTLGDLAERITARELESAGDELLEEMLADLDGLSPEELQALLEGGAEGDEEGISG